VRTSKLIQNLNIVVKLVHFPLHPDTPAEGRALQDLFRSGPEEIAAKYARMKSLMDAEGLPYAERSHTYNSRLAQELGSWADTVDPSGAIHDALYRAYFVDRRNIGDTNALLDIAESVGLNRDNARTVLDERTFRAVVDADWAKSRSYGVTGVPTFVAGRAGVVGAQPYEVIERLLIEAGAKRRF
jgi:predicted DsbA family dithiol-disulfide isomerase